MYVAATAGHEATRMAMEILGRGLRGMKEAKGCELNEETDYGANWKSG